MTDRAVLAARIRQEHAHELPTFRDPAALATAPRTITAQALESPGATLTVTITGQRFAVEARGSDPAASGTAVTVAIVSTDAMSGTRRHVQLAEPEAWARAVFAEFDDDERRIYLLGGVDADTGRPEFGLVSLPPLCRRSWGPDPGADPVAHDAPLLGPAFGVSRLLRFAM